MPPVSIRHCFTNHPLPNFYGSGVTTSASTSGTATHETDAPAFSITGDVQDWINKGLQVVTQQAQILSQEYLYLDEQSIYHASEGDIVRSSALYLLHPINQALYAAAYNSYGIIRCQSEYTNNSVRADISYYKNVPNSNMMRAFAVVEFKKRGVIVPPEFRTAQRLDHVPSLNETNALVHNAQQYIQSPPPGDASFFAGNSRTLIKQAASYAIRHRTRYVALFDWDTLVLANFVRMNPALSTHSLSQDGVGDYCETTIITSNHSHHMRAALLGFLWEAATQTP